jgi:hypothetical protein
MAATRSEARPRVGLLFFWEYGNELERNRVGRGNAILYHGPARKRAGL